jgi:RNA polymerase sigma factor (sigma-70 family)
MRRNPMTASSGPFAPFRGVEHAIEAACGGDKEALGLLLEPCRLVLTHFIANRQPPLRAPGWRDSDVFQETWLLATQHIKDFRGCTLEELQAWLRAIAERLLLTGARKAHTEKRDVRREVSVEAAEPIERTFPSTAGEVEQDEATERVRRVLARLPEDYRTVLRLHFWENLS